MEVVPSPTYILDETEGMALVTNNKVTFRFPFNEYAVAVKAPKEAI